MGSLAGPVFLPFILRNPPRPPAPSPHSPNKTRRAMDAESPSPTEGEIEFDVDEYLDRIAFPDGLEPLPDYDTLQTIVLHHALAIPFENVDPVLGRTPDLSPSGLMRKLVRSKRGGWCHEHSSILRLALSEIGFRTRLGLARARFNVPRGQDVAKGHSVLFVGLPESEEEFLLEVAYGSLRMSAPIKLEEGLVQETLHGTCRLLREPQGWVLQVQKPSEEWADVFLVEDAPVTAADIDMVNWALANRRGSSVREEVTLAIAMDGGGRMVLAKGKLTVTENGKKIEEQVSGIDQLAQALAKIGIQLGDSDLARRTLRRALSVPTLPRAPTLSRSLNRASLKRTRTLQESLSRLPSPSPRNAMLDSDASELLSKSKDSVLDLSLNSAKERIMQAEEDAERAIKAISAAAVQAFVVGAEGGDGEEDGERSLLMAADS